MPLKTFMNYRKILKNKNLDPSHCNFLKQKTVKSRRNKTYRVKNVARLKEDKLISGVGKFTFNLNNLENYF